VTLENPDQASMASGGEVAMPVDDPLRDEIGAALSADQSLLVKCGAADGPVSEPRKA
jgi:hypothetical protein